MTLDERVNKLELRIKEYNTIIKKIAKGLKMAELDDFDFDELLNDIEDNNENENNNKTEDIDELLTDDSLSDNVDDLDVSKSNNNDISGDVDPEVNEVKDNSDYEIETSSETKVIGSRGEEYEDYKKIIQELESKIKELQGALKAAKTVQVVQETEVSLEDLEFADETKAFLKEYSEIELEKKELQERTKELKADFEERGVHTKEALKAWKEYQKQLKETPEEAKEIEQMKGLINSDDSLASTANALVG